MVVARSNENTDLKVWPSLLLPPTCARVDCKINQKCRDHDHPDFFMVIMMIINDDDKKIYVNSDLYCYDVFHSDK